MLYSRPPMTVPLAPGCLPHPSSRLADHRSPLACRASGFGRACRGVGGGGRLVWRRPAGAARGADPWRADGARRPADHLGGLHVLPRNGGSRGHRRLERGAARSDADTRSAGPGHRLGVHQFPARRGRLRRPRGRDRADPGRPRIRPADCRAGPVDRACVGGDVRIAGLGVSGDGSGDGTTGGTAGARLGAGIGDRRPGLRDLRRAGSRRLEGNGAAWSGDRRHGGCDGCVPGWPGPPRAVADRLDRRGAGGDGHRADRRAAQVA